MTRLKITRPNEYINRFRAYAIYIDGKKVGSIANDQTKQFDVSPGEHSVIFRIDWFSSPSVLVTADDGSVQAIKVSGFRNSRWIMPALLVLVLLNLIAELTFHTSFSLYLFIFFLTVFLYYMTFGRSRYLGVTEVSKEATALSVA
jgi:hypothetical protein